MNRKNLRALITRHEGLRYRVYADSVGKPTIGVGFNLNREGARTRIQAVNADYEKVCTGNQTLTEAQIFALLDLDLSDAIRDAGILVKNFGLHPEEVQYVIVDMIFNLGGAGFAKFTKTIAALEANDYCTAAAQMADSVWSAQVPTRAQEDIKTVLNFCNDSE